MKIIRSKRKTTNKKHDGLVQIRLESTEVVVSAETTQDRKELERNALNSENPVWWYNLLEDIYKNHIISNNIAFSLDNKYYNESNHQITFLQYIKENHLDNPGIYEAAKAFEYLSNSYRQHNSLIDLITQAVKDKPRADYIIQKQKKLMLDQLRLTYISMELQINKLQDAVISGRKRITPAHRARSEATTLKRQTAENWYVEYRNRNYTKEDCYRLIEKRFKDEYQLEIKAQTIKSWFKGRKDLLP